MQLSPAYCRSFLIDDAGARPLEISSFKPQTSSLKSQSQIRYSSADCGRGQARNLKPMREARSTETAKFDEQTQNGPAYATKARHLQQWSLANPDGNPAA